MSRLTPFARRALAIVVTLLAGASCGGDRVTSAGSPSGEESPLPLLATQRDSTLLQCDEPESDQVATEVIGPLGGTLAIGNTRVVIPANAVPGLTSFRLTIPRSRLVEISVRAGDAEHFLFDQPVLVAIDYGRCASGLSPLDPVTVWHIDESSKSLLEPMLGVDLRLFHTVTFYTGHLSGYAVAE
jgi:hypothetical protein